MALVPQMVVAFVTLSANTQCVAALKSLKAFPKREMNVFISYGS